MARKSEFYKGRKKRRNYALIPFVIVLALIALVVVLFYAMQKYAVISKEGVTMVLPGDEPADSTVVDNSGNEVRVFEKVETELVFDPPDYSRVEAVAGRDAKPLRAIYIAAEDINTDHLMEMAARLSSGNALLLEMKPRAGALVWNSESVLAQRYGLYYQSALDTDMAKMVSDLRAYGDEHDKYIYLVAQISCCVDDLLPVRTTDYTLRTEAGWDYRDDAGTYLDPYSADVRNYIVELCRELYAMGFDEVVLADVVHPVPAADSGNANFLYSAEMSTTPSPVNAVCGFALYVANQLADEKGLLSIYLDTARALVGADEGTGQNGVLFSKVYDRIYYRTDKWTYTYNLQDMEGTITIGELHDRLVPVVINYLPDNSSWIYIEQLAES